MSASTWRIGLVWLVSLPVAMVAWALADLHLPELGDRVGFWIAFGGIVQLGIPLYLTGRWARTHPWRRGMHRELVRGGLVVGWLFWGVALLWPFL